MVSRLIPDLGREYVTFSLVFLLVIKLRLPASDDYELKDISSF